MNIKVVTGDITKLEVDAIVNAANGSLLGGGGVDGAIHRAAGPELLAECRTLHGCDTGEAKITKGYRLPAKYVIHTVGPVWNGGNRGEKDFLGKCYRNSMRIARENHLKSIAFPAISTGVYGYPKKEAAKVAVHTILDELKDMDSDFAVSLVAFDQETASLCNQEILEQANRKLSREELLSIVSFCDKWMEKFTDAEISYVELVDHYLADDCNAFGFEMDCGHAFQEKYRDAFNNLSTLSGVLDLVDDIDLLGSAIYSKWRYFNHWAYDAAEILSQSNRGWFVAVLSRMKYLADKELVDRKDEIVDDTK